jgi:DNA polymerase III subunit alpha
MHHASFVHLHVHTQYSLLDGGIRLKELFEKAQAYKLPAITMTDHGNLFGVVDFYKQALKHGLKPIIGCEVYVAPQSRFQKETSANLENAYHLVLLCKNEKGYRNLLQLVTLGHLEGFYYKPRIDKDLLKKHHQGLIALSACLHGEVPHALLRGDPERALQTARELGEIFDQDRFYLELQKNDIPEQEIVNTGLVELSRRLHLPLVATNDCHYLHQEDARAHDVLLCIQTGKTIQDHNRLRFSTNQLYFKSPEEMQALFADHPQAIENTIRIAERCNLELPLGHTRLPRFPLPAEETMEHRLKQEARAGLEKRLQAKESDPRFPPSRFKDYRERLEQELGVITQMGFSGYFLVVSDYVREAKDRGIPVGPGRGSAAGSLVAYALEITDIDPLVYGLIFERFLNVERKELPDIDVDFCVERRDEILKYLVEKYGQDHVAQIITFGKMLPRAVIRDVGRALNMPYGEVDRIAKLVPNILKITLKEALEKEPRLRELKENDPMVRDLLTVAEVLEGLPRHASTHAAGVVISPQPIVESTPLYKGPKGETLTQYDMKSVQEAGLIKFDLLGLNNLTIIQYALKMIERSQGRPLDLSQIPLNDPAAYELLGRGDTTGVFQLESSGMKDLVIKMKPENFEDLIALVALYRPGPLESGMVDDFVKRKHGLTPVEYLLPQMEPILRETYGVIVYQEQVMQLGSVLADYSMGEADILRRAMGKKITDVMAQQRERFLQGAKKKKIDLQKAETVFSLMEKFGGYGFNKSHSAAYALIAYQTAYLKAHYPLEFMVALLTSRMGNASDIIKYITECREKGIVVLPPDINQSRLDFSITEDKIRFGLAAVKNVGEGAIESILEAREKGGPFLSLVDFCKRVDLFRANRKVLESLIKCGALDSLGVARSRLLAFLPEAAEIGQKWQRDRTGNQFSLFDLGDEPGFDLPESEPPVLEEWRESQKLAFEKEVLGFYITGHPLTRYMDTLQALKATALQDLSELNDKESVHVAGTMAALKEINSKKGDRMAFATVEDLTGSCEVIVFADIFRKCSPLLKEEAPLWISGNLSKDEKGVKIIAQEIMTLDQAEETSAVKATLSITAAGLSRERLANLSVLLRHYPGTCPVQFMVICPNQTQVLFSLPDVYKIKPSTQLKRELRDLFGAPILELQFP